MMNPRWDVLGLGCTAVDDLVYLTAFPAPDSKMPVLSSERHGGGLTATALVAAARLGAHCAYAGLLGHDAFSQWMLDDLQREGLDISPVIRREDAHPVHSTILVEQKKHTRTILYEISGKTGAEDDLPAEDVIRSTRVLFVDDFGINGQIRAATIARDSGIPIVGDFERLDTPRLAELTELVDHLIISAHFAASVTGQSDPAKSALQLWHEKRAIVVVTCGDQGCWTTDDGKTAIHHPAYKVDVIDTTGCGDVFHGAYAATLTWGLGLAERIRFASAAAALKATKPGGRLGIPTREQVEIFLREKK